MIDYKPILEAIKLNKHQYRVFNKNHPNLCSQILENSKKNHKISWSEKIYFFLNKNNTNDICECGKKTKFISINEGYRDFCSLKCGSTSKKTKEKRKQTNINKYGVENVSQSKKTKEKRKQTNLDKYGVENYVESNDFKIKQKETSLKNYGVEYIGQSDIIKQKIKQTNLERYGVDNILKSDIFKRKIKQTNLERYGVETFLKSGGFKEKAEKTILRKYGVKNVFQCEKIKEKIKQTNLERYGVENPSQNNIVKEKIIINKRNKILLKWSKLLNINDSDIILNDDNYLIKNHCKNHLDGFLINYNTIYNRIIESNCKNICTICNPISEQSSIKENEIKDWLKNDLDLNIIENNRKILNGKELDIYLPDFNLAIEFNGLYWHSDLYKSKNYHLDKTELANTMNIQLIHIFEDEWIYKSDIVKSIIKAKLGLIKNKIFGRKTIIKEVSTKESSEFLNNNHIQGSVNSSIRIGLFHENELVSLMTFGKKRIIMGGKSKEDEYEMYRFCNKLDTSVIGGSSKLFKYFINNYKPKEVISYADRRYFNGEIYKKLGFNLENITKPNFWYFKKYELKRHYRFNFRKDLLVKEGFDPTKTAEQIMIERGYMKIYDSGNLKYIYNKNYE